MESGSNGRWVGPSSEGRDLRVEPRKYSKERTEVEGPKVSRVLVEGPYHGDGATRTRVFLIGVSLRLEIGLVFDRIF